MVSVLFLCTGNAARSVIAGAALEDLRSDVRVESAGTFAVEGLPMSQRTAAALAAVGLPRPGHRSKQATREQMERADLVVALAPEHVTWVRRTHSAAAVRTSTLKHFAAALGDSSGPLPDRVAVLGLAGRKPGPDEEVADPAGGDVDTFIACAHEIVPLVGTLARLI